MPAADSLAVAAAGLAPAIAAPATMPTPVTPAVAATETVSTLNDCDRP